MVSPDDALWIKDHSTQLWHCASHDDYHVLCGAPVPGAPLVIRRADEETPPAESVCKECVAIESAIMSKTMERRSRLWNALFNIIQDHAVGDDPIHATIDELQSRGVGR